MASTQIDSADYTNFSGQDYENSAAYNDTSLFTNTWQSIYMDTDGATAGQEISFTCNWRKWHGLYRNIPELAGLVDRKAAYVVGAGYEWGSTPESVKKRFENMDGIGHDTWLDLCYNMVRVYTLCGDYFAEKIMDKSKRILNIKPINPGSMKIVADAYGRISHYEQISNVNGVPNQRFEKSEILHISWNRIADEIHGIPTTEKIMKDIEKLAEAKQDLRVVFHRYVKPLFIISVDTDDDTEIASFKAKLDAAQNKSENMVVPKSVVDKIERISIPQYSSLDPLPWIHSLQRSFLLAEGMPSMVLGQSSEEDTEASAKTVYMGWEHIVKFNQEFLQRQLKQQLNIDIKFKSPPSLEPEMQTDTKKDANSEKADVNDASKRN